jgi:hypothetical protein
LHDPARLSLHAALAFDALCQVFLLAAQVGSAVAASRDHRLSDY